MSEENEREGFMIARTLPAVPQFPWPELEIWGEKIWLYEPDAKRELAVANDSETVMSDELMGEGHYYSLYKITKVE